MGRSSERGFTLIEALVAVLVLSLGLLGVAAMQLKALQSSHVSFQRSIATLAAQDAVERLWTELGIHNRKCPDPDNASLNLTHIEDWQDHCSIRVPGYCADCLCWCR